MDTRYDFFFLFSSSPMMTAYGVGLVYTNPLLYLLQGARRALTYFYLLHLPPRNTYMKPNV